MEYNVLFRIEKLKLVSKLKVKIKNLQQYMADQGHHCHIEVVFSGDAVDYFQGDYQDFVDPKLDVALCNNALSNRGMTPIYDSNIRTVPAGIGEIIQQKAKGWIEYTIE